MKISKKYLQDLIKEELIATIKEAAPRRPHGSPPGSMHQSINWSEDPGDPDNIVAIVSRLNIMEKKLREWFRNHGDRLNALEKALEIEDEAEVSDDLDGDGEVSASELAQLGAPIKEELQSDWDKLISASRLCALKTAEAKGLRLQLALTRLNRRIALWKPMGQQGYNKLLAYSTKANASCMQQKGFKLPKTKKRT